MKWRHKAGFSILEMLIVMSILAILAAMGVQAYSSFLNKQGMNAGIEHALAILQRARSYTLASYDASGGTGRNYGVHIDTGTDTFTLFYSTSACGSFISGTNEVAVPEELSKEVDIISRNFSASADDVVFQRITGDAKAADGGCVNLPTLPPPGGGTIDLRSRRSGETKTIRILPTGVIEVL